MADNNVLSQAMLLAVGIMQQMPDNAAASAASAAASAEAAQTAADSVTAATVAEVKEYLGIS